MKTNIKTTLFYVILICAVIGAPSARAETAKQDSAAAAGTPIVLTETAAPAAAETLDIESAVRIGLEQNSDITSLAKDLQLAKLNLESGESWRSSSLSLSGSVATPNTVSGTSAPASGSAKIQASVPLLPQLSIGASLTSAFDVSASVSVSPLARDSRTNQSSAAYEKARLAYQKALVDTEVSIRSAYCDLLDARGSYDAAVRSRDAAKLDDDLAAFEYEQGMITAAALIQADSAYQDAERALTVADKQRRQAVDALSRLIGRDLSGTTLKELVTVTASDTLLDDEIGRFRDSALPEQSAVLAASMDLKSSAIDLALARTALRDAKVLPDLSLSLQASGSLKASGTSPSASLSAQVSLKPDLIYQDAAKKAQLDLEKKQFNLDNLTSTKQTQYQLGVAALKASRISMTSAAGQLERARIQFGQAKALYAAQSLSEIDYGKAENEWLKAQQSYKTAANDLYRAGISLEAMTKR
jgi:outer membrane protein TolC